MKKVAIFALVSAGAIFSQQALADTTSANWYLGAGVGSATVKDNASTANLTSYSRDSNNTGAKLFAGYRFNEQFGIEGAYTNFGKEKFKYTATGVTGAGDLKANAFSLAATGRLPFGSQFSMLGKLGVASVQAKYNDNWVDTGTPGRTSGSKTSVVPMLGLGAEYMLNKSLSLRAEYEVYGKAKVVDSTLTGTAKVKLDMFSVGVGYAF